MPISKPDHVQVHRIEFAKGTNLPKLIDEMEKSLESTRYAAYGAIAVTAAAAAGITYGLYKIGQGLGDAWEDFKAPIVTGADATVGAPPVIGGVLQGIWRALTGESPQ